MIKIKSVSAKNFLVKTGLGHDFSCNPYHGCEHGCIYCYAQTMPGPASRNELWGTYVDVKEYPNYNIPKNTGSKSLFFSSMTDPYQPIEATERKTREVLESIYESQLEISILTKSSLVTRDIDLFKQMKSIRIGFSIALDDEYAKIFEPNASHPSNRIKALKALHASGIKTYVFISPIIPYVTDVFKIIDNVKDNVDYLMFDTLNLKDLENKRRIFQLIDKIKPDRISEYHQIFDIKTSTYYADLKTQIIKYLDQLNIPCHYLY